MCRKSWRTPGKAKVSSCCSTMRIKFPTWQDPRHEEATRANDHFRKVLLTAQHSQLVLMSLKPGEEIGRETHDLDQFIRIEAGRGAARLNGKDYPVQDGSALVIPAGTEVHLHYRMWHR